MFHRNDIAVQKQYKLNWKASPEILTQPKLVLKTNVPISLPSSIDLSEFCSSIKNQGQIGSCTAFASVACLEANLKRAGLLVNQDTYSERFVYYMTRTGVMGLPSSQDSGAQLIDVAKALKQFGACKEPLFPYNSLDYFTAPSNAALKDALLNQAVEVMRIQESGQTRQQVLDTIRATLGSKMPVFLGFSVYDSINGASVQTTGKIPAPGGEIVGGHAIALVGYHNGDKVFKFKNSWSDQWGDKGYGYLPYSYVLQNQASDMWVIVSQEINQGNSILDVRQIPTPTPTPTPTPAPTPKPTPVPVPTPTTCNCLLFEITSIPCNCQCCINIRNNIQIKECTCVYPITGHQIPCNCLCCNNYRKNK